MRTNHSPSALCLGRVSPAEGGRSARAELSGPGSGWDWGTSEEFGGGGLDSSSQHPRLPVHSEGLQENKPFPNPLTPASRILAQSGREGVGSRPGQHTLGTGRAHRPRPRPRRGALGSLGVRSRLFPGRRRRRGGRRAGPALSSQLRLFPPHTLPSTELAAQAAVPALLPLAGAVLGRASGSAAMAQAEQG